MKIRRREFIAGLGATAVRCPVGLVENVPGVHFQCGTCEWYDRKTCHNKDLRLNMRHVEPEWCCNKYHRTGMKTKVK